MTQFRTRRDGRRYPISSKSAGPDISELIKQNKGKTFNERVVEESRKIEIKDPENMPGKKPKNETIVIEEKETDVEYIPRRSNPKQTWVSGRLAPR